MLACTVVWFSKIIGGADVNEISRRLMNCIWTAHANRFVLTKLKPILFVLPVVIWHYCFWAVQFLELVLLNNSFRIFDSTRQARNYVSRSRLISQCFALSVVFLPDSDEQAPHCAQKISGIASRCEILIWNFQGCITVYLSRYLLLLFSAATLIEYHMCFALSTTFFIFFKLFFVVSVLYRTTKLSIAL